MTKTSDVCAFLKAYAADGYAMHEFRFARCSCKAEMFCLESDANEGVARCSCASCGEIRFIGDSEKYWADAEPERWKCIECSSETTNVGVGYSLYENAKGIRWLYVGTRCASCGILGCFAEWEVGNDDMSPLESE